MKTAMIVAPHPDDAELAMGGTIVKMISAGFNVIIVDLTDGEPTPFGSKEIRATEAQKANVILGITNRICLDMPNRNLESTLQNRSKLAEVMRTHRPEILFAPALPDFHPDHKAALELTEAARFEAKYHKTNLKGDPYWIPKIWLYCSPHRQDFPKASVVMDISDVWEKKIAAITAYQSQLKNDNGISSYGLLERVEIVAKYFGQCIYAKYGEPFIAGSPISISPFIF